MQSVKEALGVRLETNIATMERLLKLLILGVESILAVSTKSIPLQEEWMSCIANNIIISVLTALYHNILGRQTAIVLPKMEISSNISWIANFLQSQHIRPERIYIPLASILQQLAESQTGIQQYILLFLLGQLVVMLREIIVTEYIIWHSLNIQAWLLIRYRNPLS